MDLRYPENEKLYLSQLLNQRPNPRDLSQRIIKDTSMPDSGYPSSRFRNGEETDITVISPIKPGNITHDKDAQ